ncbi:hypothetical protein B0T20DRAFT_183093 [Sordaria brevicollis]|uniref:Tyrosine specific protein phosphatases domain-containing protein n=1 Tax=Sordaria brevicollis TaxID=83679 RepID=A0AAE0PI98_SORBR|nr:hypothetical protein B0T20DRAFT_183093 [Sordaria brevicollis]
MESPQPPSPSPGVARAARYDIRPPSPPTIDIPVSRSMGLNTVTLTPSPRNLDPALLDDFESDYKIIITSHMRTQEAQDQASDWVYASRRSAQPILEESMYLGPLSVVRDKTWMEMERITMVVVVRDRVMGLTSLMGGMKLNGQSSHQSQSSGAETPKPRPTPTLGPAAKKVCEELGIQIEAIAVSGLQELIREFPKLNEKIVRHLVEVHKRSSGTQEGRVLVCCETGNDRSAAVVVAYLVEVWGADLITALRFVLYRRFCVAWDDDTRRYLKNYADICEAKRMRWENHQGQAGMDGANGNGKSPGVAAADERKTPSKLKRQLADEGDSDAGEQEDEDGDCEMENNGVNFPGSRLSEEAAQRARGRNFAPFLDRPLRYDKGGGNDGAGSEQC